MKKEVKQIFIVLGLYAFAGGFFYNFQELWLLENNLSLNTIGIILSLASIISVSIIFLSASIIKREHLKRFTCILLFLKAFILFSLYFLYGTGHNIIIKFLTMADFAIDTEIYACIYPLITFVTKDDKLYAARSLIYDAFYYFAIILVGFLLGKGIAGIKIVYNTYCLIAAIAILVAMLILCFCKLPTSSKQEVRDYVGFTKLFKKIKSDKISIYYIIFLLVGEISYYSIMALFVTIFTSSLGFSAMFTSNIQLSIGISGVLLGSLVLTKLTLKNDYINISIKYLGRATLYAIALIFPSRISILIAMLFTKLTSSLYIDITDAPYINRFDGKDQLIFCNLKEMIVYFSRAIGTFLCGIALSINVKFNFLFALIFVIIQIIFAFLSLNARLKKA